MSYHTIAEKMIHRLATRTELNMEYRDIYSYALEKYLSGLMNSIIFAAVALLLRIPLEAAVIFIFYAPLRRYAGGIHARTRLQCTILSLLSMILIVWAAQAVSHLEGWTWIATAGLIFAVLAVVLFAPVDTDKRSLSPETRRRYRRLSRRIVLSEVILISVGIYFLPSWKQLFLTAVLAMLFLGILILPYKKKKEDLRYEEEHHE